jgi:hypothetical protein
MSTVTFHMMRLDT